MTPMIDQLFCEEDLVLPVGFRPYTPPGAKPIKIPTRIKAFRPLHERSINSLQPIFEAFFGETRAHTAKKAEETTVTLTPSMPADPAPSFPHNPLPVEDPADNAATGVDDVFTVVDGRRQFLNLREDNPKKGWFVALDGPEVDAQPLLADKNSDKPIYTDADGFELPPRKPLGRIAGKLGNSDGQGAEKDALIVYTKEGIPIGDFDAVAPNRAPSDNRGRRGARALSLAAAALTTVSVLGLIGGVVVGRSAVPAAGQITETEAAAYSLSEFPVAAGSSFAQHYLTLCLTHPQYKEDIQVREEMMQGMAAGGVPENCGWESGGAVGAPTSVVFNGDVEERNEYTNGQVAYLGFFVTMQDGRHFTATVPVWAGDNGEGRQAYSIVGTVGISAATALGGSPEMSLNLNQDRELAGRLGPTLETFFRAWGDSNGQELDAVLTSDATGEVRVGLDGTVGNPRINAITVYPDVLPVSVQGSNATYEYVEGDSVTAMVAMAWTVKDAAGGHDQPAGYRVSLTYQAGKWVVSGLQAGVVVPDGASTGSGADNATVGNGVSGGFGSVSENAETAGQGDS